MIIIKAKEVFKLPVAIKLLDSPLGDIQWALIINLPQEERATREKYYDFNTDVFSRRQEYIKAVEMFLTRNFGGEKRLEVTKYGNGCPKSSQAKPIEQIPKKLDQKTENGSSAPRAQQRKPPNRGRNSEYCFGYLARKPCIYPGTCIFAHSKEEVHCYNCSVTGCHATSKCRTVPQ